MTNTKLCTQDLDSTLNTAAPADLYGCVVALLCDDTDLEKFNALSFVTHQANTGSQTEIGVLGHSPVL